MRNPLVDDSDDQSDNYDQYGNELTSSSESDGENNNIEVKMVNFKAKFKCSDCGKKWTSSNAKMAILLDVGKYGKNSYQVKFKAIAY